MYVYNDKFIMTDYQEYLIKIGRSIFNRVLLERNKIWLRLGLENNLKDLILNFYNVYYLSNSLCNLVSLGSFNNSGIYHNNKNKNLYEINSKKILAQTNH